jgi:hypothetical protein
MVLSVVTKAGGPTGRLRHCFSQLAPRTSTPRRSPQPDEDPLEGKEPS